KCEINRARESQVWSAGTYTSIRLIRPCWSTDAGDLNGPVRSRTTKGGEQDKAVRKVCPYAAAGELLDLTQIEIFLTDNLRRSRNIPPAISLALPQYNANRSASASESPPNMDAHVWNDPKG